MTPADAGDVSEVVQFEDSATYPGEAPVWPAAPTNAAVRSATRLSLTIQAAERERPTILVDPVQGWTVPAPAPRYASLTLRGIGLGGVGWTGMTLPAAEQVALELCSVLQAENRLRVRGSADRHAGERNALRDGRARCSPVTVC